MLTGSLPEVVDHRKLSSDKATLDGSIPIASFPRLSELVENHQGEIAVRMQFRKGKKQRTLCVGKASGIVTMVCQNCLEPADVDIEASIRTLLVNSIDDLMVLTQDEDGLVCPDDKVALVDLVEDELIVSLPMVPRHAECDARVEAQADSSKVRVKESTEVETSLPKGTETYRPFADLKSLTQTKDKN